MRFSTVFASIIAAVAAAPITQIENPLTARASCSAIPQTTIGGKSVKGPFKLYAANAGDFEHRYATAGADGNLPFFIFGVKPYGKDTRATDFYLNSAGNILIYQNNKISYAYDNDVGANNGHIAVSTNAKVANKIKCTVNSSCAMTCSVGGYSTSCLASPKYQPDWRIGGEAVDDKPGCIGFVPTVDLATSGASTT